MTTIRGAGTIRINQISPDHSKHDELQRKAVQVTEDLHTAARNDAAKGTDETLAALRVAAKRFATPIKP
jgi:hypothetical protein